MSAYTNVNVFISKRANKSLRSLIRAKHDVIFVLSGFFGLVCPHFIDWSPARGTHFWFFVWHW